MTIERASEIVLSLNQLGLYETASELFEHFVAYFQMQDRHQLKFFARMSGFGIAFNIAGSN